jgi:hypothetical protein
MGQLVPGYGEASLGAPDEDVWHLVKVYWYTVVGLCTLNQVAP